MVGETRESAVGIGAELRISAKPVIGAFAVLAFVLGLVAQMPSFADVRWPLVRLASLLYVLCASAWLLNSWRSTIGRWFTIAILVGVILLASNSLDAPGILTLLNLPTGLAAAMISLPAALAVALCETAALVILPIVAPVGSSLNETVVALMTVWGTMIVVVAVRLPIDRLSRWLDRYYLRARGVLGEARGRRLELEQTMDELGQANRQLALTSERMASLRLIAEDAQRTKTAFVAKVSHEFRTPLNMIIGLTELMVSSPEMYAVTLPPDMEHDLEVVHRNCEHLASMIDDVLDLTRVEDGRLALRLEQVDLSGVVEEAVKAVRPLVEKKGLDLKLEIPTDLPLVQCDRTRIRQVVLNLVSNASRFTEAGGITVRVAEVDRHVVVRVADTGPGIPSEDVERIFEPFCQGTTAAWRDKGGSGLGLSVSRQFVRLHHGRMWLDSELGVGSVFTFELPLEPPLDHVATPGRWIREDWVWREGQFRTDRTGVSEQAGKRRIVVCDAGGGLARELARYQDHLEISEAMALSDVVRQATEYPAHAVMLNAAFSEELVAMVGQVSQGLPRTPVIGSLVAQPDQRAKVAGAIGHLVKPVTRATLASQLQRLEMPVRSVLVVDDDPEAVSLFARMLRLYDGGLSVLTASSGEQALAMLKNSPVDLLMLDIVMPDVDGWEVMRRISRDPTIECVPVLLVSAQDPADEPPTSDCLVVAIDGGLGISRLLECSLALSELLLMPAGWRDRTASERDGSLWVRRGMDRQAETASAPTS